MLYPTINDVSSKYGAPMGRHPWANERAEGPVKLFRVPINAGGYDLQGAYWGSPNDLWCATDEKEFRAFTRADTFEQAAAVIWEQYPFLVDLERSVLGEFLAGYVECALFTERYETEESDENYFRDAGFGIESLTPEALASCEEDCAAFLDRAEDIIRQIPGFDYERAGQLFWYGRNGHGCGFKDDPQLWGGFDKQLADLARDFGEVSLYLTEDEKVGLE